MFEKLKTGLLTKQSLNIIKDNYFIKHNSIIKDKDIFILGSLNNALCKLSVRGEQITLSDWSEICPEITKPIPNETFDFNDPYPCSDFVLPLYPLNDEFYMNHSNYFGLHRSKQTLKAIRALIAPSNLPNLNHFFKLYQYIRTHRIINVHDLAELVTLLENASDTIDIIYDFYQLIDFDIDFRYHYYPSFNSVKFKLIEPFTNTELVFQPPTKLDESIAYVTPLLIKNDQLNGPWMTFSITDILNAVNVYNHDLKEHIYPKNIFYDIKNRKELGFNGIKINSDLQLIPENIEYGSVIKQDSIIYPKVYFWFRVTKNKDGNCIYYPMVSYAHRISLAKLDETTKNLIAAQQIDDQAKEVLIALFLTRSDEELVNLATSEQKDHDYFTMPWVKDSFNLTDLQGLLANAQNIFQTKLKQTLNSLIQDPLFLNLVPKINLDANFTNYAKVKQLFNKYPLIDKIRNYTLTDLANDKKEVEIEKADLGQEFIPQPQSTINKPKRRL